jgi:hypothetical protein
MEVNNYLASGGVSGAIIAGLYIAYKCCYRRKIHSKCCGGEIDVDGGQPSPAIVKETTFEPTKTPKPSPALVAEKTAIEIPPLILNESK